MRKYINLMLTKYLVVFIVIVGVLLYTLGSMTLWHGVAMTGIVLLVVSFSGGTMKLLSTKINPNIAMALNFFLPGLGFVYCRRVYFYLIGAILFVATMGPLSWFTIPNIIGTAITNLSALSLQKVILALLLNSLLGVLAYFAAEYVKKSEGGE